MDTGGNGTPSIIVARVTEPTRIAIYATGHVGVSAMRRPKRAAVIAGALADRPQ